MGVVQHGQRLQTLGVWAHVVIILISCIAAQTRSSVWWTVQARNPFAGSQKWAATAPAFLGYTSGFIRANYTTSCICTLFGEIPQTHATVCLAL